MRAGEAEAAAGVAARGHVAEAVNERERPGPWSPVDGGIEAKLREIERRRLQRQRHVDRRAALVDREADIDPRRDARAEAGDAAHGLALVADIVALRAGRHRKPVELAPGPVARPLGRFGGAASGRIGPRTADETIGRLVAEPLQEVAAEVEDLRTGRDIGIDLGRRRDRRGRRARRWCRGLRRERSRRSPRARPTTPKQHGNGPRRACGDLPGPPDLRWPQQAAHECHFRKRQARQRENHCSIMPICPEFRQGVNRCRPRARGDCRPLCPRRHRGFCAHSATGAISQAAPEAC